jgi:hypothetical protein
MYVNKIFYVYLNESIHFLWVGHSIMENTYLLGRFKIAQEINQVNFGES